jgi:hypothetical protein
MARFTILSLSPFYKRWIMRINDCKQAMIIVIVIIMLLRPRRRRLFCFDPDWILKRVDKTKMNALLVVPSGPAAGAAAATRQRRQYRYIVVSVCIGSLGSTLHHHHHRRGR